MTRSSSFIFIHCISGLGVGGAEGMLAKLCRQLSAHTHHIIVMGRRMEMAGRFIQAGALLHPLGPRLLPLLRRLRLEAGATEIRINGWMYHGNLLAMAIRALFFRRSALVWHVRQSLDNYRAMRARTRLVLAANRALSGRVTRVLFNSGKSMEDHVGRGWCGSNCRIWHNGFDPALYEGQEVKRKEYRLRLLAGRDDILLISVGRFHPDKDYPTLLAAAQPLLADDARLHLVLIGRGLEPGNQELVALVDPRLSARIHLLGSQEDVASWLAAADIFILHSRAESFPNVLGEAVFSRRLCIATRVGDAGLLLPGGETQVPPEDVFALRGRIQEVLSWPKPKVDRFVADCYRQAVQRFSLEKSAEQFMLLSARACPPPGGSGREGS